MSDPLKKTSGPDLFCPVPTITIQVNCLGGDTTAALLEMRQNWAFIVGNPACLGLFLLIIKITVINLTQDKHSQQLIAIEVYSELLGLVCLMASVQSPPAIKNSAVPVR